MDTFPLFRLQLNLLGITLPLYQPYLHFAQRRYIFPAVPLSTGDCRMGYLFRMQLRNPSARAVQYQVSPLRWPPDSVHPNRMLKNDADQPTALGGCEYDMPVLCCSNRVGVVAANGFSQLEWRFRPLEAKSYMAYCPIRIRDALGTSLPTDTRSDETPGQGYSDTIMLELVAIAYDPRQFGSQQVPVHPQRVRLPTVRERHAISPDMDPNTQSSQLDSTPRRLALDSIAPVHLSHHFLSLDRVTLGSRARRLIHLTYSTSSSVTQGAPNYRFLFYTRLPEDMEFLEIRPLVGRICPGQSIQVEIVYTALGIPRLLDMELTCELRDEASEQSYEEAMTLWQSECERRRVEFTISDQYPADGLSGFRGKPGRLRTTGGDITLNQPMPPKPRLLHLTLGVEVVSHGELKRNWPDTWKREFIDSNPTFQSLLETTLAQTVRNILMEANEHEVELTVRYRAVVVPPTPSDLADKQNGKSRNLHETDMEDVNSTVDQI
ncbi:unnamed protein product [Echinostoma caproni]|uniref:Major sperm protein n=1 Tax=Echinostoma caproni TaxID=27848 RepID=A0A183AN91_9TREM|nr:unnamed protein product [Echinostoma caproni]